MVRTMMPGEGDEFTRQHEIDMLHEMMERPALGERRRADAVPIGRRILQAEVFGTHENLMPFELPEPLTPLRHHISTSN